MAEAVKTNGAATLGLETVAWKHCVRKAPRMGHVIPASGDGAIVPGVDDVEHER